MRCRECRNRSGRIDRQQGWHPHALIGDIAERVQGFVRPIDRRCAGRRRCGVVCDDPRSRGFAVATSLCWGRAVGQATRKKKTDYGTVIFHWLLVTLLVLAVLT